jgi:hypothetical protein
LNLLKLNMLAQQMSHGITLQHHQQLAKENYNPRIAIFQSG